MAGASPFVIHSDLGIGRLDLDRGVLRFFDSPALPEVEIPAEQELFRVTRLEVQQRIWWFDGIRWVTGRISAHDDEAGTAYLVAFPNGVIERLTAESIRVRWNRPISDVLGMLKGRVAETRFFHAARSGFLGRFSEQRAACQGLAGVLSSAVELHTHQVAAARRVLQDPVPRYLLADEVGLGKTIEAGMIARQLMIEAPGEVLVAVPPHLVSQWQRELSSKFRLDSVGGRVQVVAFGEASNVPEIHRRLVIVDEAHRLVSSSTEDTASHSAYESVRSLGLRSDALLLLSATPVRSNEDIFLRLLHLLDPTSYPLSDLEGFRARVAMRDDLAAVMSGLNPDLPVEFLGDDVRRASELVTDDAEVKRHAEEFSRHTSAGDVASAMLTVRELRNYLGESYRIHRRMIRTRRTKSLVDSFPVRGRRKADHWTIVDPDERRRHLPLLIDNVRALVQTVDPGLARTILRHFLERVDGPVEALNELLPILDSDLSEVNSAGTSAEVDGSRLSAELSRMVSDVTSLPTASTRSRAVSDWVRMHVGRQQVAVACGSAATADLLASNLEEDLGSHRVARLTGTMTDSDRAREAERYVGDEHHQCTVLVFDRSAEEGLNLQSARKILHYELGLSVNRIEQRLGRFDRWSDKVMDPVESVVFIESDAATERELGAWRRLIDDAFGVFDRSTATLQHVLPGFEDEFLTAVLEDGAAAATLNLHTAAEEVERHRRRITHQDQLDSIDATIEDSDLMEAIGCVDSDPDAILAALRTYAVDALQLDIAGVGAPRSGVGRRRVEPLLPRSEASRIVEGILAVGRRRVEYTSRRTQSIRESRPLLRFGEPLVDRLINFAELDDRGRTFISEVPIKRLAPGTPPTFLLLHDVRVQPDPTKLSDSQEELRSSVDSLALRFFPVRIERVLALHGHEAADPAALRRFLSLDEVNLASRPERLNELLRGVNWESMCDRGAISAFETVRERLESSKVMREAMSMFDDFVTRDRAIRSSRQRWGLGLEVRDEAVYDRVRAAIESPQLFLDSCGVLILTPEDR